MRTNLLLPLGLVLLAPAVSGCLLADGLGGSGDLPGASDAPDQAYGPGSSDDALVWVPSSHVALEFNLSEVTVAQYAACLGAGACTAPDTGEQCTWGRDPARPGHPVNCVDAAQAEAFCAWAGGRLPSEAEWYAEASAGGSRSYPWGDEAATCARAIFAPAGLGCGRGTPWPACSATQGQSVSGVCDLGGNVEEWTSTAEGAQRIGRGGSWLELSASGVASDARLAHDPAGRTPALGVRCVRAAR